MLSPKDSDWVVWGYSLGIRAFNICRWLSFIAKTENHTAMLQNKQQMIFSAELCPRPFFCLRLSDSHMRIFPSVAISLCCSLPAAGGPMFLTQIYLLPNCLLICQVVVPSRCSHVGMWRPASVHKQLIASLFCFWSSPDGAPPRPWMTLKHWPEHEFSGSLSSSQILSFNPSWF